MEFNWAGLLFWTLVFLTFVCFVLGVVNKSWKFMLVSAIAMLPIVLYIGLGGELQFALFLPLLPLLLIYVYSRRPSMK